jgi:hypothetical protein
MQRAPRALLTALAIASAIAITGTASANSLRLSSGTFRIVSGRGEIFGHIICPVTYEGNFHETTISKVENQLIGFITEAEINEPECTGGGLILLKETLPWHLEYAGFAGTLPNIQSFTTNVVGLAVLVVVPPFEISCLYTTSTEQPAVGIWTINTRSGAVSAFSWSEEEAIENGFCGPMNLIGSTPNVTERESEEPIVVTLI